jgi:hypothetical protein
LLQAFAHDGMVIGYEDLDDGFFAHDGFLLYSFGKRSVA